MIVSLSAQHNPGLGVTPSVHESFILRGRPDLQELRRCYDCGMSPIPAYGILTDWPEPGASACACGSPTCTKNAGKHPLVKWKWMENLRGPVRWSQIEEWVGRFDRIDQPINWAYHFRSSGLIGLDLDPRNGKFDLWQELVEKNGGLPATPKDFTPGRGYHLWFRCPDESLLPASTHLYLTDEMSVELKWGNNYFFGPPSMHRVGKSYQWENGLAPWQTPFAPLPAWLIDLAHEVHEKTHGRLRNLAGDPSDTPAQRRERATPSGFLPLDVDFLPQGYRNRGLFVLACRFRAWGWGESQIVTALLDVNQLRCSPPAPEDHVVAIGSRVAQRYPAGPGPGRRPDWLTTELEATEFEFVRPGRKGAKPEVIKKVKDDPRPQAFEDLAAAGAQIAPAIRIETAATEAAVAGRIADLRHDCFPCAKPYPITLYQPGTVRIYEKRCEKWACPGCGKIHREEWTANVRFRLGTEEGQLYAIECSRREWKSRIAKAVNRAGAEHFALRLEENTDRPDREPFLIVTNRDLGDGYGCHPVATGDTIAALVAGLNRLAITAKPIHASRGWQLPKQDRPKTGEWERLGMLPRKHVEDDVVNNIAEANGCRVQERPTRDRHVPLKVLRIRDIRLRPGATREDAEHLFFQLLVGSVIERCTPDEEWVKVGPTEFELRGCYAAASEDPEADG